MLTDIGYQSTQGQVATRNGYLTQAPERPLGYWVQCFWQLNVPPGDYCYRSVPDNSVDWIFNLSSPEESFLVSPFTSPVVFSFSGPEAYFGIRFQLFGQFGLVSEPLGEWRTDDATLAAENVVPRSLLAHLSDTLFQASSFAERCKSATGVLLEALSLPAIDTRLLAYVRDCIACRGFGQKALIKQSSVYGLSERQLRRLSHLYLGLSPKAFSSVLRFQSLLQGMREEKSRWGDFYYDQSHFIREFKHFSGLTPQEFMRMSVLYNQTGV